MKKAILALAATGTVSLMMAADGAAIYKKCVACHGPAGNMVYLGKVPALAGQPAEKGIEYLKGYKAGTVNKYGMGAVMSVQAKLHLKTDADIEAVAKYVEGLK